MANRSSFIIIGTIEVRNMDEMKLIDVIGPIETTRPESARSHLAVLRGRDDLLVQAVGSFLEKMAWEVVRVSNDENVENFIRKMKQLHPDIVVLCQDRADDDNMPWRLIAENLCLKVLTVGMDSNLMHVYSKQDVLLQGASDLLSIIDPVQFAEQGKKREVRSTK